MSCFYILISDKKQLLVGGWRMYSVDREQCVYQIILDQSRYHSPDDLLLPNYAQDPKACTPEIVTDDFLQTKHFKDFYGRAILAFSDPKNPEKSYGQEEEYRGALLECLGQCVLSTNGSIKENPFQLLLPEAFVPFCVESYTKDPNSQDKVYVQAFGQTVTTLFSTPDAISVGYKTPTETQINALSIYEITMKHSSGYVTRKQESVSKLQSRVPVFDRASLVIVTLLESPMIKCCEDASVQYAVLPLSKDNFNELAARVFNEEMFDIPRTLKQIRATGQSEWYQRQYSLVPYKYNPRERFSTARYLTPQMRSRRNRVR